MLLRNNNFELVNTADNYEVARYDWYCKIRSILLFIIISPFKKDSGLTSICINLHTTQEARMNKGEIQSSQYIGTHIMLQFMKYTYKFRQCFINILYIIFPI